MSKFFIRRPIVAIVIAILTVIVGAIQVFCAFTVFKASGEALPWAGNKASSGGVPPTV